METKTKFYSVKVGNATRKGNRNVCAEFVCSFDGWAHVLEETLQKQYRGLSVWVEEIREVIKVDKIEKTIEKNDTSTNEPKTKNLGIYDSDYSLITKRSIDNSICNEELKKQYELKKKEILEITTKMKQEIENHYKEKYGFLIKDIYFQSNFVRFEEYIDLTIYLKSQVQQLFEKSDKAN